MNTDEQSASAQIPPAEQRLLSGVEPRIVRLMWIVAIAGTASFLLVRGGSWAASFAVGAALSALSFQWMKTAIGALAEAFVAHAVSGSAQPRPPRGTTGVVARFVLRYALIGLAAYAIFRSSSLSLAAFFAGLFVAIIAILVEVAYQVYLGFRNA
jgi:hypothetical protein